MLVQSVVTIGQIPLQDNFIAVLIIPAWFKHRVREDDAGGAVILHADAFGSDFLDQSDVVRAGGFVSDGNETRQPRRGHCMFD